MAIHLVKSKPARLERKTTGLGVFLNGYSNKATVSDTFKQVWSVHAAVRFIAQKAAGLPLIHLRRGNLVDPSPILDALSRPNKYDTEGEFLQAVYSNLAIKGEAFVQLARIGSRIDRLYCLPSGDVTVTESNNLEEPITGYSYMGRSIPVTDILHLKLTDPRKPWRGIAPLDSVKDNADLQYLVDAWNRNVLDNAGVPSLAFSTEHGLDDNSYNRLKEAISENVSGATNARRPLLLDNGLSVQQMALTPADMDFANLQKRVTRAIAVAFGLDPMLLGDGENQKFSNYQEARKAAMQDVVIPYGQAFCNAINRALLPIGEELRVDVDSVPELQSGMKEKAEGLNAAGVLTIEEKREALGYDPQPEGTLLVPASMMDYADLGAPQDNRVL